MKNRIYTKSLMVGAACMFLSVPVMAGSGMSPYHASGVKAEASALKIDVNSEQKLVAGAENFIGSMAQRAIGFLGDDSITHDQRTSKFEKLLNDSFDMKALARFSLGKYWRVSTKEQRQEYLSLFRDMILDVYSHRFGEYKGQDLEVRSARADGRSDAIVTSYMLSPDQPEIRIDWRVRYKDGRYKVIDVMVEGVSMAVTQRSDFSSVIQRGGGEVDVLLAHLR